MKRIVQRKPFQVALIAASVLLAAWLVRIADPGILQTVRDATFDQYQRIAPRAPPELPIRIVDIDDDSVRRYGQWPWPRTMLAEITDRLGALGAAVVVFDMVFSEPDRTNPAQIARRLLAGRGGDEKVLVDTLNSMPDNDALFAQSLARQPSVVGFFATGAVSDERPRQTAGFAFAGDDPVPALLRMNGAIVNLPALEDAAAGIGSISLAGGRTSDVVRRIPLFLTDGEAIYPALAMETLRLAAGGSTYILKTASASGEVSGGTAGMVSVKVGDFVAPTTASGEIQLYFKRDRASDYISAGRLLGDQAEDLAPLVEGHIVLVGASAVGLSDMRITSLGETVPGVSLHAQIIEQILTQNFLERPDWADGAEFAMTVVLTALMMAVLPFCSALVAAIFGAICAAIVAAISWIAFQRYGVLIEPVFAMLTGGAVYILAITLTFAASERERRFVRSAFQHYLAPALLTKLEAEPEKLILGGEVRNITVLFMDIRNFTAISETLAPADLVAFLNRLFSPLSDIIQAHEGAIDKYIGDSIMAFWNAPLSVEAHPRKACRAALKMVEAVEALNRSDAFGFRGKGLALDDIRIGIGIATGDACVGNMGSSAHFNYSVIGDTVNVAARIETMTKTIGYPILLSQETAAAVAGMALLPIGELALKGKSQDVALYALVGDEDHARSPEFARLRADHARRGRSNVFDR
ncbi:CHASE2 domain-containing protein [Mesorhizobium xinjiangense]|uniref:CHASE2 domain-containing protein n=1 Tax=Mesorhizobium xinjiangense TaxID=2678685 RepID=UPI0012ED4E04|nr:adenylate/guanylate cyclase domain-containing protein [Mesorhizobium xinjiangense]